MGLMKKFNLQFMPSILYFGLPMGLLGLAVNAQHLTSIFDIELNIALPFLILGWGSFIYLIVHYIFNILDPTKRETLKEEWHEPFKRSFLPAITLTALLMLLSLKEYFAIDSGELLPTLISITVIHLFLNFFLINGWVFDNRVKIIHHKPTWFILTSGNFLIPITFLSWYRSSGITYEVSMFFFASGMVLWLVFSTTVLFRLFFFNQVAKNFRPSLFIFLAPVSLACVASILFSTHYIETGQVTKETVHIITWLSYSFASVMFLLWIAQLKWFISSGLSMAGWAYIYPIAAYGLATQYMALALQNSYLKLLSVFLFVICVVIITLLLGWLVKQMLNQNMIDNKTDK